MEMIALAYLLLIASASLMAVVVYSAWTSASAEFRGRKRVLVALCVGVFMVVFWLAGVTYHIGSAVLK